MTIGIVGRKCGMTRVFAENGVSTPVTVIDVEPNRITQIKTQEKDGYRGVQVTTGSRRPSRVNKAAIGHFAKAGVEAGRGIWEFRLADDEGLDLEVGGDIKADLFTEGQYVDVSGVSIGKGFQGGIKRHNFSMLDATHGNSLAHRSNGAIGANQNPGRVRKGKKMSGHMGSERCTVQNLKVVRVDLERNIILVSGSVPGSVNGDVIIKPAVKYRNKSEVK